MNSKHIEHDIPPHAEPRQQSNAPQGPAPSLLTILHACDLHNLYATSDIGGNPPADNAAVAEIATCPSDATTTSDACIPGQVDNRENRMGHTNKIAANAALIAAVVLLNTACGGGGGGGTTASAPATTQDTTVAQVTLTPVPNASGAALTFSTAGAIDTTNPFFKPFGNGRSCSSCHRESDGWSVTPQDLQQRFSASDGTDPVFRLVDGANSPTAPDATLDQKRVAYSMLLTKGVFRIGMPIPAGAEFELASADDPYGFASATELSLFRRPLPATNLKFESTIMWDSRETAAAVDATSGNCIRGTGTCFPALDADLLHQANSAIRGHAEAAQDLTADEQRAIGDFEESLYTAQITDNAAGSLDTDGARGGPITLSNENFYFGINDFVDGDYSTGAPFSPAAMTVFSAWDTGGDAARASITRGEAIFNTRPINITNVNGLNDVLRTATFVGTCSSCHSAPNAGTHSVPRLFNTGVASSRRRTPDMPLYTLKNITTGELVETTDPGSAMITGKWEDIGRFKVPGLRGLSSHAPYFHDGSAPDLTSVVRFYDRRFQMKMTPQEVSDLAAFLAAL